MRPFLEMGTLRHKVTSFCFGKMPNIRVKAQASRDTTRLRILGRWLVCRVFSARELPLRMRADFKTPQETAGLAYGDSPYHLSLQANQVRFTLPPSGARAFCHASTDEDFAPCSLQVGWMNAVCWLCSCIRGAVGHRPPRQRFRAAPRALPPIGPAPGRQSVDSGITCPKSVKGQAPRVC